MSLPREFLFELHKHFTGDIRTDVASRVLYSTDASIYQIEPLGVVIPRTQDDLHSAIELAAKHKISILPRGAGTSLAGQAIGNSLILDCSRYLDQIIEVNPEEQFAIVEPGVVLSALNAAASKYGLMFGPDPASAERATMGGVIANNATGAHSILYGMSADHLLSADVIMADGTVGTLGERSTLDTPLISALHTSALTIREKYAETITQNWPRTWRNSAGYRLNYLLPWSPSKPSQWIGESYPANLEPGAMNLATLLAGSEGTLAVMRRMKVRLVKKPKHTILAVLAYQSLADACDDVPRLLTHHPSAVELIPQLLIRLARGVSGFIGQMEWVTGDPAALLVVEFSGDAPNALKESASQVGDVLTIAESSTAQARVWNIRKAGLGILDSRTQVERPIAFIEDCAIPVDRLGGFVREVETILAVHGTYGGIYAHASGGCLHIRPMLDLRKGEGVRAMRSISEATLALTLKLGGSMSSEHGDGIARGEYLRQTYGDELVEVMRGLKRAADPHNLLNPGKLFDAPGLDTNLRYEETRRAGAWTSVLDYSRQGNLTLAIEQCNGQGVCRKTSGVMCPSFQATRNETHSTRGRANLLRALISDHSVSNNTDLTDAVAEALDLCLACKGCKAECPSGVDMAKLKYEFENQYYKSHSRPWRDYAFGYFDITAALAASVAPLTNTLLKIRGLRKLVAQVMGISFQRPFPEFHSPSSISLPKAVTNQKRVIFLSDPFAHYVEPETERAALSILARCGYDVRILPMLGAGASLLSKGMLDAAKRHARKMLETLDQLDPTREAPILGIEPPEIYCLKHDYLDLLPESADVIASRAARTWLLDEYLLRSEEFTRLRAEKLSGVNLPVVKPPSEIYIHPHCHQRAESMSMDGLPVGTQATVELLRACGYAVEVSEAGCCGMAGTFGFESEHYELSMQVGELKLFPRLRQWKTEPHGADVVATGAACRMQIRHGVDIAARHSVQLIAEFLNV